MEKRRRPIIPMACVAREPSSEKHNTWGSRWQQ
jgi:hypothetical protein